MKYLTWDEIANFYNKKTGQQARIKPMDDIYNWALKQEEIIEIEERLIFKKGA